MTRSPWSPEAAPESDRRSPSGWAGGSEEMAAAVAFRCSDEAAYTGQTLFIDGGLTLYPSFETTWSSE